MVDSVNARRAAAMKLMVLSDLHLECSHFDPDEHAVQAADVIVLAGDIHPGIEGIAWARKAFPGKPIVYVAGNHEFYQGDWEKTLDERRQAARANDVHFLENDSVTIGGVRILGCTLWTDFEFHGPENKAEMMYYAEQNFADYQAISYFFSECSLTAQASLERHQASRAWLQAELPKGDPANTGVVTHHYVHAKSTASKFLNDAMTAVFGSNLPTSLLLQAGLWIHGHSHTSVDYRIDGQVNGVQRYVRMVCNPRGYNYGWGSDEFENSHFNPGLLIAQLPDGNWGEHYEL